VLSESWEGGGGALLRKFQVMNHYDHTMTLASQGLLMDGTSTQKSVLFMLNIIKGHKGIF
jgi:hypothetical protein